MKSISTCLLSSLLLLPLLASPVEKAATAGKKPATPRPFRLLEADKNWVRQTMRRLSLREKVGQLVGVRVMGRFMNRQSEDYGRLVAEIRDNGVGSVVLFAGNVYESAILLNELQSMARLPLLVSADFERGASFRIADTTSFPWTMAVGATGSEDFAYQEGVVTAREARALGIHWIYAPVLDVNNNPDNPVINIRSYGEDPGLVARLGAAFIRGARDGGVLTTAKHFPGHGDTSTDTHIGLAVIPADRARLDALELVPFRKAIEAGVDSIMTAHVAAPALTGDAGMPATLSPAILTDLLRKDLGYQGLIVTDALEMGGITTRFPGGQAALRALKAGADMLLLPPDSKVAVEEVVRAVERGEIEASRIDRSVEKILTLKSRLGLQHQRTVPLSPIADLIASPASQALARAMADASVTLLRDQSSLLPLSPLQKRKIFSIVLTSDPDPAPGAVFQTELRRRFPAVRTSSLDARIPADEAARLLSLASECDVIICSAIVRLISGKGNAALPESQRQLIERLLASEKPVLLIAFGNPYLLRSFPAAPAYMCTFGYADVSQAAAARAIAGDIPIRGRMPVSIPGLSGVGEGLQVAPLDSCLSHRPPEELGLAREALDDAAKILAEYAEKKAFPGAALVVGYRSTLVLEVAAGRLDYSGASKKATPDTMYDLASVSKAVGTTTAAMMLAESGRLQLDAPVTDYIPEFRGPEKANVTVRHLLSHSAGLPAFQPLYREARGKPQMLAKVVAAPIEFEPGTRSRYSDLGMILLGEIIERVSGRPLDAFLAQNLFVPLRMSSTTYRPDRSLRKAIAPTEKDPWRRRIVRGEVHDENAFALGGVAGHAGLFSSARDLSLFAQMMLNGGMYDHRRFLWPETIARFTAAPAVSPGNRGLGWGKPDPASWSGELFAPSAFGHSGFTGTMIWIDPDRQLFIVLLSNRVHPSRDNVMIEEVKRVICETVVRALPAPPAATVLVR